MLIIFLFGFSSSYSIIVSFEIFIIPGENLIARILNIKNTKITKRLYNKKIETEWFMLKDEAKKLGVVGNIIGEDISLQEIL